MCHLYKFVFVSADMLGSHSHETKHINLMGNIFVD